MLDTVRVYRPMKIAGVDVDRRMLAELAVSDPPAFSALVDVARNALPSDQADPEAA